MKKVILSCLILLSAALIFAAPAESNEKNEANWSDLYFQSIPVLKVLNSKDAYAVTYLKHNIGIGKTTIPKSWVKNSKDAPRKLVVRSLGPGKVKPYLTVITKGGEFLRVILNVPKNKQDSTWGVYPTGKVPEGSDKETLEKLTL